MENSKEQLAYIEEMIATAKGNLSDSSIYFLIWGWLVFIAAVCNYYLLEIQQSVNHWLPWPILMSLGAVISIGVGIKRGKKQTVVTKIDKMVRSLWLGFTITLFVVLGGLGVLGPKVVYPFFMALYGMGTFVSGSAINFKPLQIGAVASWVCASIAFYQTDFSNHLILLAVAILSSYIIPGHLLSSKK